MRVVLDKGEARIVSVGDPMHVAFDIEVQIKDIKGEWVTLRRFHSISDDCAYGNAREVVEKHLKVLKALAP